MKTIKITGYSDDNIAWFDGERWDEMDTCAQDGKHGRVTILGDGGGVRLRAIYALQDKGGAGVWTVTAERLDEDEKMPWPVTIYPCEPPYVPSALRTPYSVVGVVEVPDDAQVFAEFSGHSGRI